MAKAQHQIDVLVLGDHPAAYLAAALLRSKGKLHVMHSTIPGEKIFDRLVMINPRFYELHPLLEPLRRRLDTRPIYGLQFLADDPNTRTEYRSKSSVAFIGQLRAIRDELRGIAEAQEVDFTMARQLQVLRLDEGGVELTINRQPLYPRAIVLAGRLPESDEKLLGIPEEWERGILHRYSLIKLKGTRWVDLGNRPLAPMSLDLHGLLSWAWLLPGTQHTQLAVEQPSELVGAHPPAELMRHWVDVLHRHGVLKAPIGITDQMIESRDLPLAGALSQEGLANRTLLIGPAGGFYSASAEDIYPNCWSAIYAADVLKKALKEPHLQDALQPYRQRWRTTLGDYLRGPQQNLRFLLPLVYRNQIMTNRLAEAILTGVSVVR